MNLPLMKIKEVIKKIILESKKSIRDTSQPKDVYINNDPEDVGRKAVASALCKKPAENSNIGGEPRKKKYKVSKKKIIREVRHYSVKKERTNVLLF